MSIRVDGPSIERTAHELQGALTAIEHELEQLAETADSLRDQWTGAAQRAFDEAHAKWQTEISAMAEILRQAIGALTAANAAAGQAESAAAALWT
jgi:WXG100 family type VII secretion target